MAIVFFEILLVITRDRNIRKKTSVRFIAVSSCMEKLSTDY